MLDAVDDHRSLVVIGLEDDAVDAPSSRAHAGKLALKLSAESVRIVEECVEHELDDCGGRTFGQPVELSFGGAGDAQPVAGFLSAHLVR
jgi:hypothetical protein